MARVRYLLTIFEFLEEKKYELDAVYDFLFELGMNHICI